MILTKVTLNEAEAESLVQPEQKVDKPKMAKPVEAQDDEVEKPTSKSASSQTQTQPRELSKTEMEPPKNNKRKVWGFFCRKMHFSINLTSNYDSKISYRS